MFFFACSLRRIARAGLRLVTIRALHLTSFDARMSPCRFFVSGFCRDGNSCRFDHAMPESSTPVPTIVAMPGRSRDTRCPFFEKGTCNKGDKCWFVHPQAVDINEIPPLGTTTSGESRLQKGSNEASSDSRRRVSCKHLARSGGCRDSSYRYLHPADSGAVKRSHSTPWRKTRYVLCACLCLRINVPDRI